MSCLKSVYSNGETSKNPDLSSHSKIRNTHSKDLKSSSGVESVGSFRKDIIEPNKRWNSIY